MGYVLATKLNENNNENINSSNNENRDNNHSDNNINNRGDSLSLDGLRISST